VPNLKRSLHDMYVFDFHTCFYIQQGPRRAVNCIQRCIFAQFTCRERDRSFLRILCARRPIPASRRQRIRRVDRASPVFAGPKKSQRRPGPRPTGANFRSRVATCDSDFYRPKSNMSKRSPIAGMFSGTHGFSKSITGFGRLSRLRLEILPRRQLRSMNFKTDA